VVALDINTGRLKWHFQTAHHDLWDYDLPSQPALYDIPDGKGGTTPALIQLTKRGQIFLLNRVTGEPIADVIEQPVPQHHQEGDWVSPTQPYSVGMPAIGAEPLSEAKMWGATFFDQLWCRIEFRKMRYEGEFTAPTTEKTLQYPGNYGGFNWGSASINEDTGYLFVNDIRMPQWLYYIPRADADAPGAASSHDGLHVQAGTPYGVTKNTFMSPLGIPCHQPPWGTMTAIDLQKRQIVWERPMSTLQDTAVAGGLKVNLPIPIGMPTMGGPLSTASGLVFFAGTQDYYLRALDAATGKELWKGRLPVGGQATPMTYISPESGRQFVVIAAGGARQSPDRGDYIVAYSLPEQ
jgi:quinate dehydrogenase (quinone)